MVNCTAIRCTNRSSHFKSGEVSFHRIPTEKKNKHLRQRWLNNIRRDGPLPKDDSFYICS